MRISGCDRNVAYYCGANDALGFAVLRRSVGIRHPQKYPFGDKECARGGIIELAAIVALDGFDGEAKLCGDISEKNLTK
jgi:hypothetical protein